MVEGSLADGRAPIARILLALAGLWIWAVQFTVIYGFAAVACARGYGASTLFGIGLVPFVVIATTLLAFGATLVTLLWAWIERRGMERDGATPGYRFLNYATLLIGALSLLAILWSGLPAVIVPACA